MVIHLMRSFHVLVTHAGGHGDSWADAPGISAECGVPFLTQPVRKGAAGYVQIPAGGGKSGGEERCQVVKRKRALDIGKGRVIECRQDNLTDNPEGVVAAQIRDAIPEVELALGS